MEESTFRLIIKAGVTSTVRLGRKATVTADQEQKVAEHVLRLVKWEMPQHLQSFAAIAYYFAEKHNFSAADIYNVVEMGIFTVQKPGRILG
jgi:hypothetical protein